MSHQHDSEILATLEAASPHASAFRKLSRCHWNSGALSSRDKHLVAVAAAQVTRCAYCIEHHARIARQLGAARNEVLAAAYITAALETLLGDDIAIDAEGGIEIRSSALSTIPMEDDRNVFVKTLLNEPTLPLPLRYVIAAAVTLTKGEKAQQQAFHLAALQAGTSPQALEEGYAVALIIRAGAVYAHTLGIAKAFE